jgi:hypothetical protein
VGRTPGAFVPLDINYPRDPAIRRAGEAAELLYVRAMAFVKGAGTDGVVYEWDLPAVAVGLKGAEKRVEALVKHGLWEPVDDGWLIRSWAKWNMSQDEIRKDRAAKKAGAILTNHKRNHEDRVDPSCPHCPR